MMIKYVNADGEIYYLKFKEYDSKYNYKPRNNKSDKNNSSHYEFTMVVK